MMLTKRTGGRMAKKSTLTPKKARVAAKAAKKAFADKFETRRAAWKKGGREWSRVLGHFGVSTNGSINK